MNKQRNLAPLAIGLLLVALGGLFLAVNIFDFRLIRLDGLRYVLPLLMLVWGVSKLVRHFLWDADRLARQPVRSSLLGGLFWTSVGGVWLLALLGVLGFLDFLGLYWPLILILFGLGKIADTYRFQGRVQLRAGEIIGVLMIVFLGVIVGRLSEANLPAWNFDFPAIVLGDRGIRVRGLWGETFRESVEVREPAEGIARLEVSNSYGDIRVEASSLEDIEIHLTKIVVSKDEEEARGASEGIAISSQRDGDLLRIGTNRQSEPTGRQRVTTDLLIRAPARLAAVLKGRQGDIRVSGMENTLSIQNSSGAVDIDGQRGAVDVANEYGRVQVRDSRGDSKIDNRRGSIVLSNLTGNATVTNAYDSITIRSLEGNLALKNHFGSVRVDRVSGTSSIEAPGSQVSVSNVQQGVQIQNSQKPVRVSDCQGAVDLQTSSSGVELTSIGGAVDLRATHTEVTARGVRGKFSCKAVGSRLSLSDLEGGFDVVTTLRAITIRGFGGEGVAQNEYDDISISTERELLADLTVINKNGNIDLRLPSDAGFLLSAQAPSGRIRSEFDNLRAEEQAEAEAQGPPLLESTIGNGGPRVRLQTVQGRIHIQKGGRARP